jgi:phenylalanyl-tRNA synthetase beta chain
LAFIVSSDVHAGEVIEAVKENAGEYLADCVLFDVYTGTGVEEGMKSLALGLIFQHPDKSLSDDEVQSTIDVVVSTLCQRYGATLRN